MTAIDLCRERLPRHIAIIMDGNGRWAARYGKPRSYGHQAGVETVRRITAECTKLGVEYLTLYTFSTENWHRPSDEVMALMGLVLTALEDEIFMRNNVRFRVIGDVGRLPQEVQHKLRLTEQHTAKNSAMTMVIALSYSARWELTQAVRSLATAVCEGSMTVDEVTEDTVNSHLTTAFMPDPDLLIRTGGELRVSNFLLWQIAYTELYFCDTYWPDFCAADLHRAIAAYQQRQRRYGLTEQQIADAPSPSPTPCQRRYGLTEQQIDDAPSPSPTLCQRRYGLTEQQIEDNLGEIQ